MQEFINLFAEMGWVSGILLVAGALLVIAECLTPGFGVAGTVGILCLILGVIARAVEGATLTQTLLLLILVLVAICVLFIVFVKSAKNGFLSRTPIIEGGTAIPTNYGENVNVNLLNKVGLTKTICRPAGKVEIGGKIYDAMTDGHFIEANKNVRVVKVEIDYLYIKETNLTQAELDAEIEKANKEMEEKNQREMLAKKEAEEKAKIDADATDESAKTGKGGKKSKSNDTSIVTKVKEKVSAVKSSTKKSGAKSTKSNKAVSGGELTTKKTKSNKNN